MNRFKLCVYQVEHRFYDRRHLGKNCDQHVVVGAVQGYVNSHLPVDRSLEAL